MIAQHNQRLCERRNERAPVGGRARRSDREPLAAMRAALWPEGPLEEARGGARCNTDLAESPEGT
jgi:hypothetical protein